MVTAVKKAENRPRCLELVQVKLLCITKIADTLHSCLFRKEPSYDVLAQSLTKMPHFRNILPPPLRDLDTGHVFHKLSMTFTADGKRQRLHLICYSFLVILK